MNDINLFQISVHENPWRCEKSLSWIRVGQEQGSLFHGEYIVFLSSTIAVCTNPPALRGMYLQRMGKCTRGKTLNPTDPDIAQDINCQLRHPPKHSSALCVQVSGS